MASGSREDECTATAVLCPNRTLSTHSGPGSGTAHTNNRAKVTRPGLSGTTCLGPRSSGSHTTGRDRTYEGIVVSRLAEVLLREQQLPSPQSGEPSMTPVFTKQFPSWVCVCGVLATEKINHSTVLPRNPGDGTHMHTAKRVCLIT